MNRAGQGHKKRLEHTKPSHALTASKHPEQRITETMSSLEIAELTEKQHKNVLSDVRNMFEKLKINGADFSAAQKYGNYLMGNK
jgi:phage regulator Rha-like protein